MEKGKKIYISVNGDIKESNEKIDIDTFKKLGNKYSKDKNNIYYDYYSNYFFVSKDVENFEILNDSYAKDKNNIYSYGNIIKNTDTNTFEILWEVYAKDKNNIYYNGNIINLENKNSSSENKTNIFSKFLGIGNKKYNTASFIVLGYLYAKDDTHIFYNGKILEGEYDIKTFEVFENIFFTKDKNNIYFDRQKIIGADPQTFEILKDDYSKDKNNVYFKKNIITGVDLNTFEVLENEYSKDKNNIYLKSIKIDGVDVQTFEVLENKYTKDKNNVYFKGKVLVRSDPQTFEFLKDGYLKDKNNVYFKGEIIIGSDPTTFKISKNGYWEDKNNIYYEGKLVKTKFISLKKYFDEKFIIKFDTKKINDNKIDIINNLFNELIKKQDNNKYIDNYKGYDKENGFVFYGEDSTKIIDFIKEIFIKNSALFEDAIFIKYSLEIIKNPNYTIVEKFLSNNKNGEIFLLNFNKSYPIIKKEIKKIYNSFKNYKLVDKGLGKSKSIIGIYVIDDFEDIWQDIGKLLKEKEYLFKNGEFGYKYYTSFKYDEIIKNIYNKKQTKEEFIFLNYLEDFWNTEASDYNNYTNDIKPTEEIIKEVEEKLGYKLPKSYIEFMKIHNGGVLKKYNFTLDDNENIDDAFVVNGFCSIGKNKPNSLLGKHGNKFWIDEWGYPDQGIYFGDTIFGGHVKLLLDYSKCGKNGEPEVCYVDQELDYENFFLAENFDTFISLLWFAEEED